MSESTMESFEPEQIGFAPLGEVFADARNAKKLELKDISNNLRLSIKQIEALENNDFSSLPQPMITRGFIRNYARLLEIDAGPLLESYRIRMPEVLPSTLNVQTSMNQIMKSETKNSSKKLILLSILILFSFLAWNVFKDHQLNTKIISPVKVKVVPASPVVTTNIPLPEAALPVAERMAEDGGDVVNAAIPEAVSSENVKSPAATSEILDVKTPNAAQSIKDDKTITSDVTKKTDKSVDQNPSLPKVSTGDLNTQKSNAIPTQQSIPSSSQSGKITNILKADASNSGIKSVAIAVTEQTWVRVSDKTGKVVFEKTLSANSEDGFDGQPPFKMLIGNVKGTKVKFLGQLVDLTPSTKNNIAHVTLE